MAIHLPSNLYSEGQVPLNSNAFTQFYLQSKIRQRAKDEALDNYFRNFTKSVNPAGMRTQDIENGWMQKVNDWQDFYTQNAHSIKNPKLDNGKSLNEFEGRYQDILNDTEKSKNLVANTAKIAPIFSDPNKRTRVPDSVIEDIHKQDLPMYDPNHKPFNIDELNFDAKPFDATAQSKFLKGVQTGLVMGDLVSKTTKDAKNHQLINTYHSTYSPETLDALYKRAASSYRSDPSFKDYVDNDLNSPIVHQQLNDKFKATYGKDIESLEDMAAAWTLNSIQTEKDKQKATGYNPFLGMSTAGQSASAGEINNVYKDINDKVDSDLTKGFKGTRINALNTDAQNIIIDFIRKTTGGDYLNYSNTFLSKDDNGNIGIYETTNKDGAELPIVVPKKLIGILPQIGTNLKVQPGVQEKRKVISEGENKTVPPKQGASKSYNINGKSYNQSQIEKGAAHYGLTVEEYLKQLGVQ